MSAQNMQQGEMLAGLIGHVWSNFGPPAAVHRRLDLHLQLQPSSAMSSKASVQV